MDYDDSIAPTLGRIDAGDPLPPDDRCTAGGASAAALFGVQQPRLTGFLKRRAPAQDVGDLVQECFRRVLASRAYPRILAEQPGAYLFRTARHLLAERRRADQRRMAADHQSFEEPDIAGPDPHAALEARDEMRRVAEALDRLKPKTREIFLMHRFEGLGYILDIWSMSDDRARGKAMATTWRSAASYASLIHADRRSFGWEWLRRHPPYQAAWRARAVPPAAFGLLAYVDPTQTVPDARPIWASDIDARILDSRPGTPIGNKADQFDIRNLARYVSIAVDAEGIEHWLLSDGLWQVRLDIRDGTLLGGPVLLEHVLPGLETAARQMHTLRQLIALAQRGHLPPTLRPREARAPRWILELRTADALASRASYQEIARSFFGKMVANEAAPFDASFARARVQRLVRKARQYLGNPFSGPWFREPR